MKIKNFRDWSIFYKILGINIITISTFIFFTAFYVLPTVNAHFLLQKENTIKEIVNVSFNVISFYNQKYKNNEITLSEAQNLAKKELTDFKFGDNDYFWINDLSCKMIMHGANSKLDGTSMLDFKDPNGKYMFREFVEVAKESGSGFVEYYWPKPGFEKPVPKISYVKLFKDWGWVLGSGIYTNDVHEEYSKIRNMIYLILAFLAFVIIGISLLIAKKMSKPINYLRDASEKLMSGDLNVKVDIESKDEIGELAKSFNYMAERVSTQIQYLDNLTNPVMVIDPEFNIQYMNKKGAEVVGKNQDELIGKKCYDQFKTDHCKTENCALHKAMKHEKIFIEETIANPNNVETPILYSGSPIKNRDGKITGALELVTSIKEIKDLQNYLARSTNNIMNAMEQFEKGDLTVEIKPEKDNDDIGRLFNGFNKTVKKIRSMIDQIKEAVSATASASTEISASSEEMAAGAQEQSQQATEIAGAIEQMTRTIFETSKNASSAAESAKNSGTTAKQGGEIVNETIEGMNRIAQVVKKSAETVQELGKGSDEIGDIIQVIDDIADQTNLLALNAAIEAARAGEQGRGFAVVADEVRKLADRTTKATKEIAEMIKKIQKDTGSAVDSMQEGTEEVEKGITLADKAGTSLNEIISGSNKVVDIASQVATASEEQSATSEQISKNIEAISNVTNQSAAGIQQIARASEDLNKLTENLQRLLQQFRISNNNETSKPDGKTETNEDYQDSNSYIRKNGKLIYDQFN